MLVITSVVFIYYASLSLMAWQFVKKMRGDPLLADEKLSKSMIRKCVFTFGYAVFMLTIGVLYMTALSLHVLTTILISAMFGVSLIEDRYFLSSSDIKIIKKK